jgi:pimeloyl-ACP methyl ester carboxylesterase
MPSAPEAHRIEIEGFEGITLVADLRGPEDAPPVLFLHGGGQTRHAWGGAAQRIAEQGWRTVTLDLRGHGESDWAPNADYSMEAFSGDVNRVIATLGASPVLVGASLGGITAMMTEGAVEEDVSRGLVLVDISPLPNPDGVTKIRDFMESGYEGFATLDEAGAAIAAYTPQRKREVNYEGLKKVLRERDGRWWWHWDPAFMKMPPATTANSAQGLLNQQEAMRHVHVPTLLVRGMLSDIVTEEGIAELKARIPQARVAEVGGASHMIAGDKNDAFSEAVISFLADL